MSELPIEEPEADTAEQRVDVTGSDDHRWPEQTPLDVDEADAAEQSREVSLDEDEYR